MTTTFHSLRSVAMNHADLREQIKALCDDEQAIADTLEGASNFHELCAAAMREANVRNAYAAGIQVLIEQMQMRAERHMHAYNRTRELVLQAMQEAGERQIKAPDMTITVKAGSPSVRIVNETEIPEGYMKAKTTYSIDKKAIGEALKAGQPVAGAELSNSQPTLELRVK